MVSEIYMSEYLAKEPIQVMDSKSDVPDLKKLAWAFPEVSFSFTKNYPYYGR